jgi:hypothetical protein
MDCSERAGNLQVRFATDLIGCARSTSGAMAPSQAVARQPRDPMMGNGRTAAAHLDPRLRACQCRIPTGNSDRRAGDLAPGRPSGFAGQRCPGDQHMSEHAPDPARGHSQPPPEGGSRARGPRVCGSLPTRPGALLSRQHRSGLRASRRDHRPAAGRPGRLAATRAAHRARSVGADFAGITARLTGALTPTHRTAHRAGQRHADSASSKPSTDGGA